MRRDLQAAFKDYRRTKPEDETIPEEGSPRWKELFEDTELTRPVDFHSWRRKFVQALADMGMNAQQAQ